MLWGKGTFFLERFRSVRLVVFSPSYTTSTYGIISICFRKLRARMKQGRALFMDKYGSTVCEWINNSACFCYVYCAYVLRISRY